MTILTMPVGRSGKNAPTTLKLLKMKMKMRSVYNVLAVCLCVALVVQADLYMHNPRGSNNRLNEQSATRNNNNRVFDSQNNARGGYNVGDRNDGPSKVNNQNTYYDGSPYSDVNKLYDPSNEDYPYAQYPMLFMEESELRIEWTNQHGCGGDPFTQPAKQSCRIIVQYMCETGYLTGESGPVIRGAEELRDGWNAAVTTTPKKGTSYESGLTATTPSGNTFDNRRNGVVRHESENYYYECSVRRRNQGLFIADQNINNNQPATYTRQNPNGGQSGLECPEERDYYPYWSPAPWKDIAIITDNDQEECDANGLFKGASQNNNLVYRCVPTANTQNNGVPAWQANNRQDCEAASGQWIGYSHNLTAPFCVKSDFIRNNHLGNTVTGNTMYYNWKLPSFSNLANNGVKFTNNDYTRCVLRLRYNISTTDFDPNTTDYRFNGDQSPVKTNEAVDIGSPIQKLTLNVNTAQFARTFQDRSHTFFIRRRPDKWAGKRIINLNIRGKRGNIVQNYPSVEYDFVPGSLTISNNDLLYIQWTGSNTHNNNGNGGDGQTGADGQGATNTDRNNFAQMLSPADNYPIPYDKFPDNIFSRSMCYYPNGTFFSRSIVPENSSNILTEVQLPDGTMTTAAIDCAVFLWSSGFYTSRAAVLAASTQTQTAIDQEMNTAPASLIGGVIMEFYVPSNSTYYYLSTRNNAFSNRSQKGRLNVTTS